MKTLSQVKNRSEVTQLVINMQNQNSNLEPADSKTNVISPILYCIVKAEKHAWL